MLIVLVDDHRQGNFDNLIDKMDGVLFGLMKLTTNGSDTNLYAVSSLMKGNPSRCLVSYGSNVSGDSGCLQSWSTSKIKIGSGPAGIIGPEDQKLSSFTLEHTIALLYSIEDTMSDDDLRQYKNECFGASTYLMSLQ